MRPIVKTLLIGAGAVVAYSLIRKKAAGGNLVFFAGGVQGFAWEGMEPVINISISVQNTSNQSFTIKSFAGNLFSDGFYIGNLSSFVPQTIGPNSQATITLAARLQMISVVNDIIKAIQSANFQKTIELKAMANVDNLQIPVNQKFNVGG